MVGVFLLAGAVASFCVGKYPISVPQIAALITGGEVQDMTSKVFFTLRVPRTIMAVLGGMGLGLAGGVYQNIFKNPLASPDIIGISSGANMGAAIAIVSVSGTMVSIAVGAFAGGLAAVMLVMILVQATKSNATSTYVLAGIIISALANTVIMLLKYYADSESELAAIEYWTMGSLASITASKVWAILPFWLVGFGGLLLLHRQIGLLSLNEEECRALGVRLGPIRITVLLMSTLLVASVICVTGLISFAGLIAPHIARMMIRRQNSQTLMLSSLVGGGVLLISDILARTLYAAELPISILTTLIGVPILLWFMCKRRGGVV
ncbi:MAG: iron ABC transporter permease [Oscillospiraceae bacterium]|nr:iron ABC transporter permease [Oscillospiraceae bacterium]